MSYLEWDDGITEVVVTDYSKLGIDADDAVETWHAIGRLGSELVAIETDR